MLLKHSCERMTLSWNSTFSASSSGTSVTEATQPPSWNCSQTTTKVNYLHHATIFQQSNCQAWLPACSWQAEMMHAACKPVYARIPFLWSTYIYPRDRIICW